MSVVCCPLCKHGAPRPCPICDPEWWEAEKKEEADNQ